MQAKLLNNSGVDLEDFSETVRRLPLFTTGERFLLLALNYVPLLHAASSAAVLFIPFDFWPWRAAIFLAIVYLAPALVARLLLAYFRIPEGRVPVTSKYFFVWWASSQLQVLFCRFPALEETLRLIPGLYSAWLRLWGAKIGRFTYWSTGTVILDRPFLRIGNDVVFGAGVRLNAHVLAKGDSGQAELILGTLKVGDGAIVGGYSLLTAGSEISAREITKAFLISPPFTVWKDGKRIRR